AADTDLLGRPQPILQLHALQWRYVHGRDAAPECGIWRRPRFGAALHHLAMDVVSHLPVTRVNAIESYLIAQLKRGAHAPQDRNIGCADVHEALGFQFRMVPAVGGDRAPDALEHFRTDVKEAGTLRREEPFVRAGGVEVAADVVDVERHHAGNVRAVEGGDDALAARQRRNLFDRQDDARIGGDVAHEDDARARRDGVA